MAGRPRMPTRELETKGSFKHDPQRKREREHEPEGGRFLKATDVPLSLPPEVSVIWLEFQNLAPWLKEADLPTLEMAAHMMAEFRAQGLAIGTGMIGQLRFLLGELGFNPAKRAALKIEPKKEEKQSSPWDNLEFN